MARHSEGASGGWRRGRVTLNKDESGNTIGIEVGPSNVKLDGSNYKGARGASFSDIRNALKRFPPDTRSIHVAVLIRRDSQARGFRWISANFNFRSFSRNVSRSEFLEGLSMPDFTEEIMESNFPISNALTWSFYGAT
jgi:hypothetical protein